MSSPPFYSPPAAQVAIALLVLLSLACAAPGMRSDPAASASAAGDIVAAPGSEALHEYLDRLARVGAFSGAVLVARGDTVLLHGGYGFADARLGIPVTRRTVFDIGSVAKQFAAAAVLRLELEGRLRTSDSLAQLFPEAPADKREITIDQLLTHTSGLPGDLETDGERTTAPDDPNLAARLLALPLESVPGAAFRYSNAGYALVRLAIGRATGVPFQRYVAEQLLRPAGLTRTGWHGDTTLWKPADVARGAWGLYDSGSPRDWPLHGATLGAGEMISSPGELFRWLQALDAGTVLPEEARRKLFTPRAHWGGTGAEERGAGAQYAYGWEVRTRPDGTVALVFHNGIYDNFRTTVRRYSSDDATVIVMTNSRQQDAGDRADEVGNALRDLMLGKKVAVAPRTSELPPATLDSLQGSYELSARARFDLRPAPGRRLWLVPHGQEAFDAIWQPNPERRLLNERVARVTLDTIESLGRSACPATGSGWGAMFCGLIDRIGPFDHAELEGVAPLTWSTDWSMSYTVLHFAKGRITVTWEWRGVELLKTSSDDDVSEPQSIALAPVGPGELVMYDWFTDRSLPVTFVAEQGRRSAIVIGDGAAPARALRLGTD